MRFHSAWIATTALLVASTYMPPARSLCAAEPMDPARLAKLIEQLDDEKFKNRQAAEEEIRKQGAGIVPQLQKALDKAPSLHVHRRLEMLIAELGSIGWNSDLSFAVKEAQKTDKPILVFSTIGEPKGFAWLGSNLMRTVTFAKPEMIDFLKTEFVLVWHNQSPNLYGNQVGEQEPINADQMKAYPQGGGGGNVRTYFLTPDGDTFYYLEGYWNSERFLDEARFAIGQSAKLHALKGEKRLEAAKEALKGRIADVAKQRADLRAKHPEEFAKKVFESEIYKKEAALGLLEKSLTASIDLLAKALEPILAEIQRQNTEKGIIK